MELKKSGILYVLAYGYTSNKPSEASLCRFFWRILLSLLVWISIGVVSLPVYSLGTILALVLFAQRPVSWKKTRWYGKGEQPDSPAYDRVFPFQTMQLWRRSALSLSHIGNPEELVPPLLYYLIAALAAMVIYLFFSVASFLIHLLGGAVKLVIVLVLASCFLLWFCLPICRWLHIGTACREFWQLFRAFLRAKAKRLCPIIHFVE